MNKLALIPVAIALTLFVSCGKQQTEAEKNAEVERQVQQRLKAEHQAETRRQLAAREADLATRKKNWPTSGSLPQQRLRCLNRQFPAGPVARGKVGIQS